MILVLHKCPTCGADTDQPCRTPKGRRKPNVHDTRPFSLTPKPAKEKP